MMMPGLTCRLALLYKLVFLHGVDTIAGSATFNLGTLGNPPATVKEEQLPAVTSCMSQSLVARGPFPTIL